MAHVVIDRNKYTAIELSRLAGVVKFIPTSNRGFDIEVETQPDFDERWKVVSYPIEKAAKLFVGYACDVGGSAEALAELSKLCKVLPTEIVQATNRMRSRHAAPVESSGPTQGPTPKASKRPAGFAMLPIVEESDAWENDTPAKPVETARGNGSGKGRVSDNPDAIEFIRSLIMKGELTDDDIFAKAKKKGAPDSERVRIAWHRFDLKRNGKNPPPAVRAKSPART